MVGEVDTNNLMTPKVNGRLQVYYNSWLDGS